MLRDKFVLGLENSSLAEKLLAEDSNKLTFDMALKRAEAMERARADQKSIMARPQQEALYAVKKDKKPNSTWKPNQKGNCYRCGSASHLANSENCSARKATCKLCGKVGHYQRVCKSNKVNAVDETPEAPEEIFALPTSVQQ